MINALFLSAWVVLGAIWYLYVLETLGYTINKRLHMLMMLPGALFTLFNVASIWT